MAKSIDKSKKRLLRVITSKQKRANTIIYKLSLPSPWLKQMGVCENDRLLELNFEDNKITISKVKEEELDD